ncbi:MAG: tetratricopeptide repeat protein [Armatimonadetes bacterium]|nr:tetratricopeptide repeat protein [Armatimonadota bacterium]
MIRTRFAALVTVLLAAPVVAAPPRDMPFVSLTSKSAKQFNAALNAARMGDAVRAIALCRAALKESPRAAPIWATLAGLLSEQGYAADAVAASRKAVALEPKDPAFLANLSDFLLRAGESDAAEKTARRALAINPKSDTALSALVSCYLTTRRDADAIPLLMRLQTVRGGQDRAVAQNLIAAQLRVGDRNGALATAQKFATFTPADPEAMLAVVDLATQAGNVAVAEKYIARLAKIAPKSPLPAYYRGRLALTETGKPPVARLATAESALRKAVSLAPKEAMFRVELGVVLITQAGNLTGAAQGAKLSAARTQLTAALMQENHNREARRALAVVAEGEKNWVDAAAQY